MSTPDPQHHLDYATPRRRRRRVHGGYLTVSLLCLLLMGGSYVMAGRHSGVLLPMPDPPPKTDPYWQKHRESVRWLLGGCCGMPVFGVLGLFFMHRAFAARRHDG